MAAYGLFEENREVRHKAKFNQQQKTKNSEEYYVLLSEFLGRLSSPVGLNLHRNLTLAQLALYFLPC